MIRKTSAMVEAGILAAIAIVFAIISMYVPVIGSFINFLWPLPIAICGMRNGLRWSVMTLIVADIAVAVLISPLHAFSLLAAFGLVGLTLGECMRRGYKPFKLMLISSTACLISIGASLLIALYIMGIHPVDMMFTSLEEAARESADHCLCQLSGRAENFEQAGRRFCGVPALYAMECSGLAAVALRYFAADGFLLCAVSGKPDVPYCRQPAGDHQRVLCAAGHCPDLLVAGEKQQAQMVGDGIGSITVFRTDIFSDHCVCGRV